MNEIPEPWATAAEQAGIRQTLRGIAEAARISHVTVGRLIGEGRTSPATITAVATALRVEPAKVYEWAHVEVSDWGPWTPPILAHRLSPRARAALSELILAIVESEDETYVPSTKAHQKSRNGAVLVDDDAGLVVPSERVRSGGEGLVGDPAQGFVVEPVVDEHEPVPE